MRRVDDGNAAASHPVYLMAPGLLISCEIVDGVWRGDDGNAAASHPEYL